VPRERTGASVAFATVLLGVTVLVGCDDANPSPAPMPSKSPSASDSASASASASASDPPSESPSPSATPPSLPAEAKGTSEASAKAFAKHYFDTVNYATRTGDTADLRTLGNEDCVSCAAIESNVEKIYSAGGRIESDGWHLRSASSVPLQPRVKPILDLGVFQSPEKVVPKSGSSAVSYDGGKQPMTMHLVREGAQWRVNRLDLVA